MTSTTTGDMGGGRAGEAGEERGRGELLIDTSLILAYPAERFIATWSPTLISSPPMTNEVQCVLFSFASNFPPIY